MAATASVARVAPVYNHAFSIPDKRSDRALRIERRNLKYFRPSAAALLLVLHHDYLLLNRQIALEALEALLKNRTVFLSCGPFVLKSLLQAVENHETGKQWLTWLRAIELDWVTFPDLRMYPPDRTHGRDAWWFEAADEEYDNEEVDVDYVRSAAYDSHYDEHDHTGGYYDDNFYDPSDAALYPTYQHQAPTINPSAAANDISTLFDHNPFQDAEETYHAAATSTAEDLTTKLDLLVEMEVAPLFSYLSTSTFLSLASMTLPLYFISRESFFHRRNSRPGYTLPLKVRYWVHVAFHAFQLLHAGSLSEVRIKYMPWDIWASMDSCDDLHRMVERGVWFNDSETDGEGGEREHEGEAFRCVWAMLVEKGLCTANGDTRMDLAAKIRLVKWDGEMDSYRVGDELEVVFTKVAPNTPTDLAISV
ncbi:hypothetical protein E8E12_007168 [Didymella heteroderae]|uniref:Uncharacterized protein n=1 Tax=Didymella heteroderae TaxID=1769908 RepID=A0A9P4WR25_9PLEO|nr:hypothetical protein E8E12_007168 [Didymella heteroderae]